MLTDSNIYVALCISLLGSVLAIKLAGALY